MLLIDKPYVSKFLKKTIIENQFPVLRTPDSENLLGKENINFINNEDAILHFNSGRIKKIYSTSENSIEWIHKNINSSNLANQIEKFKDKTKFRHILKQMYPDFYFREIELSKIDEIDVTEIPLPFIIKPSIGFFSLGVYRVDDYSKWDNIKANLKKEITETSHLYPEKVVNSSKLIIEEYIEGEEFAFDAYFNSNSEPVILSVFKHIFSGEDDVEDRIYFTSKDILNDNLINFRNFLKRLSENNTFTNFPLHAEIRISPKHGIIPIEINPLRFGGWCTTADANFYANGFNQYEYYMNDTKPDWDNIINAKDDSFFSMVVLNNSTGYETSQIAKFDYDSLLNKISNPLELRKIDINKFPLFGFVFIKTEKKFESEIHYLLNSDLKEFVILK